MQAAPLPCCKAPSILYKRRGGLEGAGRFTGISLSIPGCCNRKPYLFEFPTPGSVDLGQVGLSRSRSWTSFTGEVRSSRKDTGNISSSERFMRWTVKSEGEQEQKQKDEGIKEEQPKSVAVAPTHTNYLQSK